VLEAALVAWLVAVLGDRTLRGLGLLTFGKPEREALTAAMVVARDAMVERVPPFARAGFAEALVNCFTGTPVVALDGEVTVRTAIIEGLLAQVRPLADPDITTSGRSYLSEIGVDEAEVIADLPGIVIRSIQQVGATRVVLQPLVGQLNADIIQADTQRILNAVQSLLQAQVESALPPPGTRPRHLHFELLEPVIDALQLVPSFSDYNARNSIISSLRLEVQGTISRSSIPRIDIVNTVRTCANYTGGLDELLSAIRVIEGDSNAMQHLDRTILSLTQNDLVRREIGGEQGR
jgi:hypothetical protein